MRASTAILMFAGIALAMLGLSLLGVAAIMVLILGGSDVLSFAAPYFFGGALAVVVGVSLAIGCIRFGIRRSP